MKMPRKKGVPPKRDIRLLKSRRMVTYKPEFADMLIEHMRNGESFPSFAAVIGCHWDTLYDWCDPNNPRFHSEFSEAKKTGEALLLRADEKIGRDGMKGQLVRPRLEVGPDGKPIVTGYAPAQFSAQTYAFTMKNRYPSMYKERQEQVISDPDGKALPPAQLIVKLPRNGFEDPEDSE